MPKTAILFLVGAIAIGGIPPLNGFISEFLIYCGLLEGIHSAGISQITLMILAFAGISIIGGISILTFTKTFGVIFLGTPRQKLNHGPHEVSTIMLIPQYITIAIMFIVAFFPGYFLNIIIKILYGNIFINIKIESIGLLKYLPIMKEISLFSFLFLIVIGIIFIIRFLITKKLVSKQAATWGCAYLASNTRMQYTGKSFSKSFGKLLNFVLIEKKNYKELKTDEIFPKNRKYNSFYLDFFEHKFIDPFIHYLKQFISLFNFIQNGKVQAYVLYGIIFILIVFIGTLFNILN
jgi:NADH:ubiquinone oxidoreductase subunit 5 (subunit L)/multisubunit Na+/H+ antiporter MnhA subunit